jgi:hypothetical protein
MPTPFEATVVLMTLLLICGIHRKRWPTTDECTELLAYGAGALKALELLRRGQNLTNPEEAWTLMTAGIVILLASFRGTWRLVRS